MKAIKHKGNISSITAKVDGSISYRVNTPELDSSEKALFMELQNINLDLTIKPEGDTVPAYKINKEVEQKTPGQRLRAVFFVMWKNNNAEVDFEQYYVRKMNQLIEHFKAKIDS